MMGFAVALLALLVMSRFKRHTANGKHVSKASAKSAKTVMDGHGVGPEAAAVVVVGVVEVSGGSTIKSMLFVAVKLLLSVELLHEPVCGWQLFWVSSRSCRCLQSTVNDKLATKLSCFCLSKSGAMKFTVARRPLSCRLDLSLW